MKTKELNIVTFIKKYGLAKAIDNFKLICRVYDKKILLKYSINSPMGKIEVQECRGLILEKDTWKVLNYTFSKFFNAEEGHAAKIDWNTAHILQKVDGTLIQLYWDWNKNEWCAATSGMAEGEGEVNNKIGSTFSQLFWNTVDKIAKEGIEYFKAKLTKGWSYAFELTTPYNIIVTPHTTSSITLLMIRNLDTFEELDYSTVKGIGEQYLYVPVVKRFNLNINNVGALKKTFEGMPFSEEGYVVVDSNFNRIKVKNPAYVAAHFLKSKTANYNIMNVIKSNEIEEFSVTFPEKKEEILRLYNNYNALVAKLEEIWEELKLRVPNNITPQENKKYAEAVFEVCGKHDLKQFSGLYFSLKDNKVDSVKDFMLEYDNRKLYKML